jgi:hypothetical protein
VAKKKIPWTKAQLATLHECWKTARNRKECLKLVSEKLPEIPPPVAWSLVRKLSRSDREWQMTARQKERERDERRTTKERVRQDRLKRREERQLTEEWKEQRGKLRTELKESHATCVAKEVGTDFFFCPDVRQHICRLSCIFRVFSEREMLGFLHGGPCEKCERMDEYIPVLEKIIRRQNDERQEIGRNKTIKKGRKDNST